MELENQDFSDYEPMTYDPGWTFTAVVVAICILLNLSLPLVVRIGKSLEKRWGFHASPSNTSNEGESPAEEQEQDAEIDDSRRLRDYSNSSQSPTSDKSNSPRKTPISSLRITILPYSTSRMSAPSSAASVVSDTPSATSAYMSHITSAVLDAGPTNFHHRHAAERRLAQMDHNEDNIGYSVNDIDDNRSVCMSVLSKLDQDAVSVKDAVDALEGYPSKDDVAKQHWWERFIEIAEWDFEMKRIASLAVPFSIQGAAQGVFQILNVAILGKLLGVREANAYVVVTILLEFTATLNYGFSEGMYNRL
jgi:hypothetical protein